MAKRRRRKPRRTIRRRATDLASDPITWALVAIILVVGLGKARPVALPIAGNAPGA